MYLGWKGWGMEGMDDGGEEGIGYITPRVIYLARRFINDFLNYHIKFYYY